MEPSLTNIANKYGTDKGTEGPVEGWRCHNYTDVYEAYLWPMRHQEIRLLEIGLGVKGDAWNTWIAQGRNADGGASIKMWAEYFPRAHIFGVDINPASYLNTDRITTFIADQGSPAQLRAMVETAGSNFDVIIDDGSHRADHQQIAFGVLFDHLRTGGLYFIEDLYDNGTDDPEIFGGITASQTPVLNTRRVFQGLAQAGALGTPNALGALDIQPVEWAHFHAPTSSTTLTLHRRLVRPLERTSRFRAQSEELVVLRRR